MTPLIPVEEFLAPPERTRATLSPDGTRIAFLAPWKERLNVWVAPVDDLDAARCVTADETRSIHDYSWADDRWLVYVQDDGGDEHFHLFRVDLDDPDAAVVDLTPFPGARVFGRDLPPGRPGTVVVWINHRRADEIDTCEIDLATGELTVLVTGDSGSGTQLAPGGDLYGVGQDEDGDWTVEHRAPSGEVRTVLTIDAADHPIGPFPVQLTPDGTGLWLGRHGHTDRLRLVHVDLATGTETEVAGHPRHDVDTRAQVFPTMPSPLIRDRAGELLGVRYSRERQEIVPVGEEFAAVLERLESLSDGDLGAISTDAGRRRWLVSFVHDREWGATWLYDHATGEARTLFRSHPHLDPETLAPTVPVTIRARDGRDLPSYLTVPLDRAEDEQLPMVLVPHGGPWTRDSWGHDPTAQIFANRGYAVLQVNFRGSTGFGREHMQAAIGEFAGTMQDDLVDAVEWAVTAGHADPARIGIFGGSYGGYATLTGVTRNPNLFAAAVDYVGISNLATFMLALPEAIRPGLRNNWYAYVGDPTDPAAYADMLERSPITHADRIVAPLMVFQGANDVRVPQSESDTIVASLRDRGVEVAYRVYDDEGHMFAQTENLVDMFRATERFLAEHLGGRSG
ncbi:S9 family peptidase [Actinomycetospora sp. OC33-EN08]|uniref:S9 family peptidase n=1 Tax=Actinomycetospora aurantiaca TaxID=3129233 RepID=A0ABU8MQZ3_9PSEU